MTTPTSRPAQRVLLIGWDAADWRIIDPLLEQGLMPNLKAFLEEGVMGNVASLTPMLSPILWTSIATGKHADKHRILGFVEPDGTGGIRPVTAPSRRCKALWNILSERGLRSGVVNWFASHPAERIDGFVVTDRFPHPTGPPDAAWPAVSGSVHPASALDDLLPLRVHPAQTQPAQVRPFIPLLHELDVETDEHLKQLRVMLAHCATVHAAATHLMQTERWDFLGIYNDAIDRFGHVFMPFHPPQRAGVSDDDYRRFRDVMTACYRFHDLMLGRLMQLAGADATVIIVSDHGFYSDDLRPEGSARIEDGKPLAWHRPYGVLAIRGPHVKRDQRVYGASLLDIAPTVLAMLGLPVADDMDGQALTQIYDVDVDVDRIATYEDPDAPTPAAGAAPPAAEDDPWVAQQILDQLAALGYVEDRDVDEIVRDRDRNLAQVYLSTGRPQLAVAAYEQVLASKPDDTAARMGIASARLQLGELDACEAMVRSVLADDTQTPRAELFQGVVHFRRGDADAALACLRRAEAADPHLRGLQVQIGQVCLHRERWADAQRAFETAIAHDADEAEAYDGLGLALRQRGRIREAIVAHMESIGRRHHRPQTHVHLGLALAQVGRIKWAVRAFETALTMSPDHPIAHQALAQLHAREGGDAERAAHHRQRADEVLARLAARKQRGTAAGPERTRGG